MAETTPPNIDPDTDPQVENPPSTEVPASQVDVSPAEVSPAVDPQVENPPSTTVPMSEVDVSPTSVDPATDPEVPQSSSDLPSPITYPEPTTPTQDSVVIAQAPGIPVSDASTAVNRPPNLISVPVSEVGGTPINPQPGVTEPRLILDANLPNQGEGFGGAGNAGVTRATPLTPTNDPVGVVVDETGTISNIQRNPETGELYNTGIPPTQLSPEQLQRLQPAPSFPGVPAATTAQPPATQVQTTPAPITNQDYASSGDAAALDAAQRAENEAFRQGRIPAPVVQDAQAPTTANAPSASSVAASPQPATNPPNPQIPAGAETGIDGVVTTTPASVSTDPQTADFVYDANGELVPSDSAAAQAAREASNRVDVTGPDPASNLDYGSSGDAAALEAAQQAENEAFRQGRIPRAVIGDAQVGDGTAVTGDGTTNGPGINGPVPGLTPYGEQDEPLDPAVADIRTTPEDISLDQQYQDEPEGTIVDLNTGERVTAGQAQADAARAQALVNNARNQQSIRDQRRNVDSADWRVRLRLAPGSTYLYNAEDAGILEPLSSRSGSDGVIFPYTPTIQTVYKSNYSQYDLTHSNYRGYFYQGSVVEDIQITGIFTAQDTLEAQYLLAVIHFFRSVTKMFYGQDPQRGAPPPLVYLSAFGEYQYVDAPCVVNSFNYNLPADVDYIRARSPNQDGTNLLKRRNRQSVPTNAISFALERLRNASLPQGGKQQRPPPPTLGLNSPTYVPTKIEITVVLHPVQSRQQISQQFSLRDYAAGRLQPKGYW